MDELQSWADHEPTLRRFSIEFDGSLAAKYIVRVWTTLGEGVGEGCGNSIVFAAVRAFDDLSAKMSEAE